MDTAGVIEKPDDLACIVDAECIGDGGAEGSSRVVKLPPLKRKPWLGLPLLSLNRPTIWPVPLIPRAAVPLTRMGSLRVAEGSSRVVKMIGMLSLS